MPDGSLLIADDDAMQHLKQHRAEGPLQVTLLSSFLQRWLLPRIGSFNSLKTGVELRFHTGRDPVDFSRSEMHVAIRMGLGKWPGLHVEKLLDEWVIPISSPALLTKYGPVPRGEDLQHFPLLGREAHGDGQRVDEQAHHRLDGGQLSDLGACRSGDGV